jgi:hypothetical protein
VGSAPASLGLTIIPYVSLRFVRKLGEGAFGVVEERVWNASPVAVKANGLGVGSGDGSVLDAEIRLYGQLRESPHPNIVTVMGVCTDAPDGKVRLVMRLCSKGSLDNVLKGVRAQVRVMLAIPHTLTWFTTARCPRPTRTPLFPAVLVAPVLNRPLLNHAMLCVRRVVCRWRMWSR